MRLRSTDFDQTVKVGASVVELEAEWRPDLGVKPCRINLQFECTQGAGPVRSAKKGRGGWVISAVAAFFACWAALPL